MLSVFIALRHGEGGGVGGGGGGCKRKHQVFTSRALHDMVVTVIYEDAVASSIIQPSLRCIIDIVDAS